VCAQKNQAEICEALLDTLQDQKFMALLYPDEIQETRQSRIHFITDLYLNTPDKGVSGSVVYLLCSSFPSILLASFHLILLSFPFLLYTSFPVLLFQLFFVLFIIFNSY
jgi:hypothetical protein